MIGPFATGNDVSDEPAQPRNLAVRTGNRRRCIPKLEGLPASGVFDAQPVLTRRELVTEAIEVLDRLRPRRGGSTAPDSVT